MDSNLFALIQRCSIFLKGLTVNEPRVIDRHRAQLSRLCDAGSEDVATLATFGANDRQLIVRGSVSSRSRIRGRRGSNLPVVPAATGRERHVFDSTCV